MNGKKNSKQKGQVLLLIAMLLATSLTIVLSLSFRTATETQLSKLEEENLKALAAAEAGIEFLVKQKIELNKININSLPGFSDFSGEVTVDTTKKDTFITPLIKNSEQYTFYLADFDYSKPYNSAFSNYWDGSLDIYFGLTSKSDCVSLELTFIKSDNSLERKIIDPCGAIENPNNLTIPVIRRGWKLENIDFIYKTEPTLFVSNNKLLIVRVLFGETRIGLRGNTRLPLQGKDIQSEVKSPAGSKRKIQLYQSYPQLPSDFFVTSF